MHATGVLQALVVVLLALRPVGAGTKAPSWIDQSWFFAWDPPGARFPVPITAQCETLHITWSRQTATGPDPVAPYFLHIFTSNFIFPFIVPAGSIPETYFTIPFAPGTEYEICMFDSNNSTGGCQAVYTVYPNTTTSTPTCTNLTMPERALKVSSEAAHGTLSQFGWVDSCSDIRVTPLEGTPPFTFTVAPALHPPLTITSNDMSSINWTVNLSWGLPFFISLVDSTGLSWSNGPIHAGKGGTACFVDTASNPITAGIVVAVGIAGVVFGGMFSLLVTHLLSKKPRKDHSGDKKPIPFYAPYSPRPESAQELRASHYSSVSTQSASPPSRYERLPSSTGTLHEFHVEPFIPEPSPLSPRSHAIDTASPRAGRRPGTNGSDTRTSTTSPTSPTGRSRHEASSSQVYVIHHDSGGPPVSVVTAHGTEVVELPPGYSPNYSSAASPRTAPAPRRQGKPAAGSASNQRRT